METNRWKQEGKFYLWNYVPENKNYHGFHCSADIEGAESFCALLKLLESDGRSQKKTVSLAPPSESNFSVVGCKLKPVSSEKLVLSYVFGATEENVWELKSENGKTEISFGLSYLHMLSAGASGIIKGKGDYCIGKKEESLWLWWQPKVS